MDDTDTPVVDDRRAAIEAAFAEAEGTANDEVKVIPQPAVEKPAEGGATPSSDDGKPVQAGKPADAAPIAEVDPDDTPSPVVSIDKPPQSWRGPQKAKWAALDPDVRQEVIRREREIMRSLGETAQARQLSTQFQQAIQPYQARINSLGAQPIQAVQELLKADYILSTAPKTQRAQLMAKLINDYGVDVMELDAALAGKTPADPVSSRVEQLLQERLAPLQQYLTQQQMREQMREQQSSEEITQTIEQMSTDPKYPYFEDVREDMADLVDISAKRGVYITLAQAYTRAIAMNPEVSKLVAAEQETASRKASALAANAKAQKALSASVSVSGSPSSTPSGTSVASDRRATIAAAFESVGGR